MSTMSIGQLAERAGVAIDTVRYYERNGLLRPASRDPSGYRRYGSTEAKRLRFIRRAKSLGFTLDEVRELLSVSGQRNVAKAKQLANEKLASVEARIAELERLADGLRELVATCPGHGRADHCPILNALEEDAS